MNACVALPPTLPSDEVSLLGPESTETNPKSAVKGGLGCSMPVGGKQERRSSSLKCHRNPGNVAREEKKMDKGQGSSREMCSTEMSLKGLKKKPYITALNVCRPQYFGGTSGGK